MNENNGRKISITRRLGTIIGMVVLIALGAVLLVHPAATIEVSIKAIGLCVAAVGIILLISFLINKERGAVDYIKTVAAFFAIILGIMLFARPLIAASVLPFVMGILIAISGAIQLYQVFELKRLGISGLGYMLLLSIITIALGVLIFANPFEAATTLIRVIGISMIYDGVVGIILSVK